LLTAGEPEPGFRSIKLNGSTVAVLTLQGEDVAGPTVTDAEVYVFSEADEVCRMAIVSPLLTPGTGPAVNAPPFMEMAVQPELQAAVTFFRPPPRITASLVMLELVGTPVCSVKENGDMVGIFPTATQLAPSQYWGTE
jgi:hypothetical protein